MKIEITILGLLMEGNLYGYEIKKKIVDRIEDYADIKFGSIYYAIKKAVDNGWVQKVGTEKESGNPERYIYEILSGGRKHYKRLLKQYFEKKLVHFDADIILMFLKSLPEEQRLSFLKKRINEVEERLKHISDKIKSSKKDELFPEHVLTYIQHHLKAEKEWLKSL